MKHKQLIILSSLIVLLASSPMALATNTWYVDGVNGSDSNNCLSASTACKTIGHAISLASSGDSIIVAPATYTENLSIVLSLNVIGSGASTTIIDGHGAGPVIAISGYPNVQIVTLSNITIRNGVYYHGGGIFNSNSNNASKLTISNSTISGNLAILSTTSLRQPGYGGGVYNSGQVTINNSTITGNSASCYGYCSGEGGGIYNAYTGATLTINNSTLAGNVAGGHFTVAEGGGIYNNGRVTINNSTLSGNSASLHGRGDNIYSVGAVGIQNSIVAKGANGNCYGSVTSNGYNMSSDGTCNFNKAGDLNNHDALLGPLQNNGGPTDTMALLAGSPAIDGGNPIGCTDGQGNLLKTDQRGMPRPDKEDADGCDMGAYEGQSDAGVGPLHVVPNVVGETQAAATTAIADVGLVVGTVTQQSSFSVASGDVISESPAAGTNVAAGSAVNLVVSTPSAPSPLLAPSSLSFGNVLAGTISAPQSATLTNAGNAPLTIFSMTYNDNAAGGFFGGFHTTTCVPNLTIAPGASCTISIEFEANSNASGPQSGSVIMNFAAGGSANLQLSANVIP